MTHKNKEAIKHTLEACIGACMTEKQRTVFLVIDEYWRNFGYGPSIDDIMFHTGDRGRGNVHRVVKKLCDLGICRRAKNSARSVRPSYLKLRNLP
jgi:SOS-response transcriptional repressor LexA